MNPQQQFEKLVNAHKLDTNDVKYDIENVGGPPHMPIFCCNISILKKDIYCQEHGRSKKEAMKKCLQSAIESLNKLKLPISNQHLRDNIVRKIEG